MFDHAQAITYAGTDGIISMFALLLGLLGTSIAKPAILITLVLASVSNAISMAVSDFNSRTEYAWSSDRWVSAGLTFLSLFVFAMIPVGIVMVTQKRPSPVLVWSAGIVALTVLALVHARAVETYDHVPVQIVMGALGMLLAYRVGMWSETFFEAKKKGN